MEFQQKVEAEGLP